MKGTYSLVIDKHTETLGEAKFMVKVTVFSGAFSCRAGKLSSSTNGEK